MAKTKKDEEHCSFCGRPASEAGPIVSGLSADICQDCAKEAMRIFNEHYAPVKGSKVKNTKSYS